jgi:hypothetical protein
MPRQFFQVRNGPQAAADETLDLDGPTVLFASTDIALLAVEG